MSLLSHVFFVFYFRQRPKILFSGKWLCRKQGGFFTQVLKFNDLSKSSLNHINEMFTLNSDPNNVFNTIFYGCLLLTSVSFSILKSKVYYLYKLLSQFN